MVVALNALRAALNRSFFMQHPWLLTMLISLCSITFCTNWW